MIFFCVFFSLSDADYWNSKGKADLNRMLKLKPNLKRAKNVIIFVGDGMGIQTHTMSRIFKVPLKIDIQLFTTFFDRGSRIRSQEKKQPLHGKSFHGQG